MYSSIISSSSHSSEENNTKPDSVQITTQLKLVPYDSDNSSEDHPFNNNRVVEDKQSPKPLNVIHDNKLSGQTKPSTHESSKRKPKIQREAGKTPKPKFSKLLKLRQGTTISTAPTSHCDLCNRTFKRPSGLLRHNKYLHKEVFKSYSCNLCYKNYTRLDVIKRHIRNIHNIEEPTDDQYTTYIEGPREASRKPKVWSPPFEAITKSNIEHAIFQIKSAVNYNPPEAHRSNRPIMNISSKKSIPPPLDLSKNTPTHDEKFNLFDDELIDLSKGGVPVYATPKSVKKPSLSELTEFLTHTQTTSLNEDLYLSDNSDSGSKHSSVTTISNANIGNLLPDPAAEQPSSPKPPENIDNLSLNPKLSTPPPSAQGTPPEPSPYPPSIEIHPDADENPTKDSINQLIKLKQEEIILLQARMKFC